MELTPKQQRFVREYLIDLNAKQAAIRAGYSAKTAEVQASRLLSNAKVAAAVAKAQDKRAKRTEITADRVLREYARIGFFDPRRLYRDDGSPIPLNDLDDDTAAAVAGLDIQEVYEGYGDDRVFVGYTKKYKVADKIRALDAIAKHLGMFVDRVEHSGRFDHDISIEGLSDGEIIDRIATTVQAIADLQSRVGTPPST